MNETELRQYNTILNEAWKYFRTYAEQMPMSDATWNRAILMTDKFVREHPEHEVFARALILVIEHELEVQDKAARKEKE